MALNFGLYYNTMCDSSRLSPGDGQWTRNADYVALENKANQTNSKIVLTFSSWSTKDESLLKLKESNPSDLVVFNISLIFLQMSELSPCEILIYYTVFAGFHVCMS